MSDTAPKRSVKNVVADAKSMAERSTTSRPQAEQKEASILQTNSIARTMLNNTLSPEAKRDELVKALTFSKDSSKEENRAKLEAFNQFKEYLQEQRKLLNREGIKLQDTEAFAELQAVIDEMTKSSIEFQDKIRPLLEVLTAVFEIRRQDKINEVYREIQNDKEWQRKQEQDLAQLLDETKAVRGELLRLERRKASLTQDRALFGLGPIKKQAKVELAEIEKIYAPRAEKNLEELYERMKEKKAEIAAGPASDNPELAQQKAVLKEFLDLTREDNRDRQKALIDAAVNYVDTSDSRLKSVLGTLDRLGKHAEVMADANGMLRGMHLIMDESLKDVSKANEQVKADLQTAAAEESAIARMTREEKLNELNEHIVLTNDGAIDIANSIGGLTKHSVQIQSYKDSLRNESGSTKRLHLEGVSQMGEQLMSVLSAISAAATSESRSVAANSFAKMAEQNQVIISQEVVRNASNIEVEANHISNLVGELQDYGDVLNASSEVAAQGYGRMRETVDAIRKVSDHVQEAIQDLVSERADSGIAAGGAGSAAVKEDAADTFQNPFDKLKRS